MSTRWLSEQQADELMELATEMAVLITAMADDVDDAGGNSQAERELLARFDSLHSAIDAGGTYPSASTTDAGYWVFTREQLDRLTASLDQHAAAIVLQAMDSPAARQLGLHILPKERAA